MRFSKGMCPVAREVPIPEDICGHYSMEVDIDHYYIILKECDIYVEDNSRLVILAMSDI